MMPFSEAPQFFFQETGYKGQYPPFHNADEFEWVKEVEKDWEIIRNELYRSPDFKIMNGPQIVGEAGWKGLYLINFGWKRDNNCSRFPETMKILNKVPNLTFAAFSILEPGAALKPHYGDTNTIIRCVLGLEIPAEAPLCALKVADKIKSWKEGGIIMFSECHLHTAWNHSDRRRIILSFDTMRPEYLSKKHTICARVLASETLFFLNNNFKWFYPFHKYCYFPLYWILTAIWRIYLPLQ